nr:MAG TPA: hypothetical protein [Bacteriophage sp.]
MQPLPNHQSAKELISIFYHSFAEKSRGFTQKGMV